MGATTHQEAVVEVFKTVARTIEGHLTETVGKVESRALEDIQILLPSLWRKDLFDFDILFEIVNSKTVSYSVDDEFSVASFCRIPIDIAIKVGSWH